MPVVTQRYNLEVRCETKHGLERFFGRLTYHFYGKSKVTAWKAFQGAGWKVKTTGETYCPVCVGKKLHITRRVSDG